MIMLHGLGDSAAGFHWLPQALDLPWMNYLLVNAPDAYFGGFSWYDYAGDMVTGVRRSTKLLFELLDTQRAKGFATEQTVLGGFSQGCLMTVEVGLRYPHLFAGLVGISGYVCEPEKLVAELSPVARQQRLFVTHGFQDPIIPFTMARDQFKDRAQGREAEPRVARTSKSPHHRGRDRTQAHPQFHPRQLPARVTVAG